MANISSNVPFNSAEVDEKPEDVSFDGEWEVVEEAFSDYDLRHNWFVSIRARKGHVQHA